MNVEEVEPSPPPVIEETALHVELLGTLVRGGDAPPGSDVPGIEEGRIASGSAGHPPDGPTRDGNMQGESMIPSARKE